jgi:hypothetical protein
MEKITQSTINSLKKSGRIKETDIIGGKLTSGIAKDLYKDNIRVNPKYYIPKDKKKYFHNSEIEGGRLNLGKAFKTLGRMTKHSIEDVKTGIEDIGHKAVMKFREAGNEVGQVGKEIGSKIEKYGDTVLNGRDDYPPYVRELINKYGNETITEMTIDSKKVSDTLTSALNVASLGAFDKRMKRSGLDSVNHLAIILTLSDGKRLKLEKEEAINLTENPKKNNKQRKISNIPSGLTLKTLLDNGEKYMGEKWFKYSASSNNCQDFIMGVLKGSSIGSQEDYDFVKQNTEKLFKGDSFLRKLSNTTTDLGGKVNEIAYGAGVGYDCDSSSCSSSDSEGSIIEGIEKIRKRIKKHNRVKGGKINIAKSFRKLGSTVKKGFYNDLVNPTKDIANDVADYTTKKKGGLASLMVHKGIPIVAGLAGSAAVSALAPELGLLGKVGGSQLGQLAGNKLADYVGDKTGTGMGDLVHIDIGSHNAKGNIKGEGRKRGRKKKSPVEVVITEPKAFRRANNSSLEQLLEASRLKEEKELKKSMKNMTMDISKIKTHIGAGLVKGSPEAKEKMARIRAMKKSKN